MFSCVIHEGLNECEALFWAHWQAVALWLPLAQQEAAGWWAPPPTIPRLQLRDFMPYAFPPSQLPDDEMAKDHGLSQGTAGLHLGVRVVHGSPL